MHVSAGEEAQAFVTLRGSPNRGLAKMTAERHQRETEQLRFDDDSVLTGG